MQVRGIGASSSLFHGRLAIDELFLVGACLNKGLAGTVRPAFAFPSMASKRKQQKDWDILKRKNSG
jgi:hypothetical protein